MISLLYVDDEPGLLEVCRIYLERTGEFSVTTSVSAIVALSLLEARPFDAIIADYQMPEMDGIEFLAEVRKTYPEIPFILFTGKGREEIAIQAFDLGADFYIQKGGDPKAQFAELMQKARHAIRRHRAEQALRESENLYRALFQYTEAATIIIEEDTTISLANEAFAELLGRPREEIEGKIKWPMVVATEDLEKMREYHRQRRISAADVPSVYEFRFVSSTGERHQVLIHVGMIPGTKRSVASLLDITDQRLAEEELQRRNDELRASYEQVAAAEEELRGQVEMLAASEQALRQQEEKIRSIFRVAPVGIGMIVNRVMREANDTLSQITGYRPDELVGQDTRMLYPTPEEYDRVGTEMYRQISGKGTGTVATRWKRKDGTVIDVLLGLVVLDPEDLNRGVTFSALDVTGRLRADQALRESEERYRQLFEHANDGITITQDGKFVTINPRFARQLGYSREEIIGKPIVSIIHPEDQKTVIDRHFRRLRGEEGLPDVYTFRVKSRTGEVVWVELNTSVITWKGKPATLNVVRDITERRQAEVDLRESEERYRSLLVQSFDAVAIHSGGKVIYANDAAMTLFGATSLEQVINRNVIDFVHPDSRKMVAERIRLMHEKPGVPVPPAEEKFLHVDGTAFDVEVVAVGILHEGHPAVQVVFRDITDRKRCEESMTLAHRKLNLMSTITRHDIRNRLTVVTGYLDLAAASPRDPKIPVYLQKVQENMDAIESLIEFTRDYQDIGIAAPQWQDVTECFVRAEAHFDLSAVAVTRDAAGLEILADPLLERVFYNLLDNSFAHGGRITSLSLTSRESSEGMILTLEDNGTGVRPGDKARIFEQGFGRKSGLGLFLAREILAITGIAVRETGEFGSGARFDMVVPKGMYRIHGMP